MGQRGAGIDSRTRILDVAEEMFREFGFHAVSLIDVARAVGMRKPSLYHHFPGGKEELFLAVQNRMFERVGNDLAEVLNEVTEAIGPDENLLERGLHRASEWFLERPPMFLLSMIHHDMPALDEETRSELIRSSYGVVMRPIVDLVIDAQRRGDARQIEPHSVAGGFLSVFEGTIIASRANLGGDLHEMVRVGVDLLAHGAAASRSTSDDA